MRNRFQFFVHAVATTCGDFTVGFTMAVACTWVIQSAGLGLFLSFLLWLLAVIVSLALSQYVIHPLAAALLSERKLDQTVHAAAAAASSGTDAAKRMWRWASNQTDLRRGFAATWR